MEVGVNFKNLISYNENMAKGMEDKLWFIRHLTPNEDYVFVDFGCADGTLISILSQIDGFKNSKFIGYDISDSMIDLAKTKFPWSPMQKVTFTTNWDEVKNIMNTSTEKKVLILSSVIHEVYSYGSKEDIEKFWNYIKVDPGFDCIFVRDMMVSSDIDRTPNEYMWKHILLNMSIFDGMKSIKSFEKNFGKIETSNRNIVHFLLKYRWQINWDREVNENYFPIDVEEFIKKMSDIYNLNYFKRFRVPFLDKCIKEDFNIELNDYTHIKAFFEIKKK